MGKWTIAALVSLPLTARAETLLVEYEGTVSSIDRATLAEAPPYAVGDSIKGTLVIDTARAPRDALANDATIGRYYHGAPGLDFILGPTHPPGNGSGDLVLVHDDWDPPASGIREDGMIIKDRSIGTDGESNLLLGLARPNSLGQIFFDDALVQSFAVESEPGTKLWGYIERGFGEFWRMVSFTVNRLSVKPGACRA